MCKVWSRKHEDLGSIPRIHIKKKKNRLGHVYPSPPRMGGRDMRLPVSGKLAALVNRL